MNSLKTKCDVTTAVCESPVFDFGVVPVELIRASPQFQSHLVVISRCNVYV